jgi:hypothetical protein
MKKFELAYKKMYILRGKMPIKSFKSLNLRKKLKGFFSWI